MVSMKSTLYRHKHIIGAAFFLLLVVIAVFISQKPSNPGQDNGGTQTENYCAPESRNAEVCMTLYKPVCGWFDADKIQCFRYPCAANYPNSCVACIDEKVAYWTEGECPK